MLKDSEPRCLSADWILCPSLIPSYLFFAIPGQEKGVPDNESLWRVGSRFDCTSPFRDKNDTNKKSFEFS